MILSEDRKVQVAAARLRLAVIAVMTLIAVTLLIAWIGTGIGSPQVLIQSHVPTDVDPLVFGTALMILTELALWRLTRMLKAIAEGESFTARVTGHFRGFAFWLMLMAIADLATPLLANLFGTAPADGGGRHFVFTVDLSSVITLGVTMLLFLLARLLERARAIEEENREIV